MTKSPKMDKTNVTVNLHLKLTKDELHARSHDCARLIDELDKSEAEFKEIKKEWNDKHKELRGDIKELALAHVTGHEYREVECEQVFDLKAKKTWYDFDGAEYEKRDMTEYEIAQIKQGSLLGDGANVKAATKQKDDPEPDPVFDGSDAPRVANGPF